MKFHYYRDTDSLYVELRYEPSAETREIADGLNVDLDARGNVVGFDVDLNAEGLDPQKATAALTAMGPAVSEAVRLLFNRIAVDRALPIEFKVPNALTRQAMAEVDEMVQRHRARFARADGGVERMRRRAWAAPEGYAFDRDEANQR